jgi:rusticyanin
MNRFILLLFFALLFSANAFAHEAFTPVSREKRSVTQDELIALTKERTVGKKEGTALGFTEKEIRLIVLTGPLEDMLSYRIQGMRNPTLVVPSGATLKILFVNMDFDMRHDLKFAHARLPFPVSPDVSMTVGSEALAPETAEGSHNAEELVIKANSDGQYMYFCSIRGHAKGGMWGNIAVGVQPGKDLKMPEKTEHVHSPDEDMESGQKPSPTATPHQHGEKPIAEPAATPMPTPHQHGEAPKKEAGDMAGMDHGEAGHKEMKSIVNIGDPMGRESSGTAWVPDSSPMYARMKMYKDGGMLMLMGSAFLRYTRVGSTRDVSAAGKGSQQRFDAPSMFMLMYSRPINEKSQFGFRTMVSLDPIIQRGYGYPLLYQSGELFHGQPIHDRQHPHDFISELAVSYSYKFNNKNSLYLYAGYPGEPALGPPTFMHRTSASNNPDAPISHHWQDATHITWGVITGGVSFGKFKLEASAFKGEEPNENRWDFDRPRLDSFSGRFSWNPGKNWALQVSHGYLKNPEPSEPDLKILGKTTASAIYNKRFSDTRNWAATFAWGQNYGNGQRTNSFLFESNYDFDKNAIFGRAERVQKSGHDLVLDHVDEDKIFWVGAFSLGYVRDVFSEKGIDVGLGGQVTFNQNPAALVPYYGGTAHAGYQVFLRIRPSKMK